MKNPEGHSPSLKPYCDDGRNKMYGSSDLPAFRDKARLPSQLFRPGSYLLKDIPTWRSLLMKRNVVAWAALAVSTAALVSSQAMLRTVPAASPNLQISDEGQKVAKALSESFVSVADFIKPSVVSIQTQRRVSRDSAGNGGRDNVNPRGPRNGMPKEIDPKDLQDMLKDLKKRVLPEDGDPQFEQQQYGVAQGTGSGIIYDGQGHILTNNHVVENAEKIVVTFHDGEEAPATIVGRDPKSDIAVIKVQLTSYRPALRGKSDKLRVGEWVLAVGSPFGFDQSVTAGIISAMGRGNVGIIGRGSYEDFIQTDAAINPGNSGGPLVDLSGRVIGINSAIATATRVSGGVGFAIPISMAENIADRLIKDGKVTRAAIGIALQPLTPALVKQFKLDPKQKGVLVQGVLPGSPAEKAGLKTGDIIVAFDDYQATAVPAFRHFVSTCALDKSHVVTYYRDGQKKTLEISLAPADKVLAMDGESGDDSGDKKSDSKPKDKAEGKVDIKEYGFETQELTPDLARSFGFEKSSAGALISKVTSSSPAEASGLAQGDLITQVVQEGKINPVSSPKQLAEILGKTTEVTIYVQSAKGGRFVTLSRPASK